MLRRVVQSLRRACNSIEKYSQTTLISNKELESSSIRHVHSKTTGGVASPNSTATTTTTTAGQAVLTNATTPKPKPTGLASVPFVIKALGFGGAIPFWALSPPIASHLPLGSVTNLLAHQDPALLQIGYGATIISFLGGVHWGLAMTSLTPLKLTGQRYVWSVLPCLLAWPTLTMQTDHAAGIQAALLGMVYLVDRGWYKRGGLPPWYMSLRLYLTGLAASGLVLTAVAGNSHSDAIPDRTQK